MKDIQKLLKPRTLIVTPHDPEKSKVIDIEAMKQNERDLGYMPIVLEESIECNIDIDLEGIASVVPFMINNVDRVVVHWMTESIIHTAVTEHCFQTEKECERV